MSTDDLCKQIGSRTCVTKSKPFDTETDIVTERIFLKSLQKVSIFGLRPCHTTTYNTNAFLSMRNSARNCWCKMNKLEISFKHDMNMLQYCGYTLSYVCRPIVLYVRYKLEVVATSK